MKRLNILYGIVTGVFGGLLGVSAIAAPVTPALVKLIPEVKHDVSKPLSEMALHAQLNPRLGKRVIPLYSAPLKLKNPQPTQEDDEVQSFAGLPLITIPGLNLQGLGIDFPGYTIRTLPGWATPPDTNAAVGLTQVVQWVNTDFVVFDKNTGRVIQGATPGNAIWAGFGGSCETMIGADPIVKYDQLANRWVMTAMDVDVLNFAPPFLQCVAVSTTPDVTGTYHRYAFSFGDNFNDYPKLGVWPDAYYMSCDMYPGGEPIDPMTKGTPMACAMDRVNMLAGNAAMMQCFQPTPAAGPFLPADLDGSTPPPAGTPNYFVGLLQDAQGYTDQNNLAFWAFHVDWLTPTNSYFAGPAPLKVKTFNPIICNNDPDGGNCVRQPGVTDKLFVMSARPMYRLAYRNFGSHQSLVVNHTIQVGDQMAATRWYELRVNNQGKAVVFQQGTYAQHDDNNRWMGSIAMDRLGNMAMGYSISGPNMFPSICYTGRVFTDPLNTMRTENTIFSGTGSQLVLLSRGSRNRWGDYSSMAIDPSDDCTFWYTTEYLKTTAYVNNWSTRLASFRFPNCRG